MRCGYPGGASSLPCVLGHVSWPTRRRPPAAGHRRPDFRVERRELFNRGVEPSHEHEWRVFEDVKLPEGATLVPGVVGHCTDFIEHPDLVADAWCATPSWSAARTSWPAPIAGSALGSATLRSAGPSSKLWPKEPGERHGCSGAASKVGEHQTKRSGAAEAAPPVSLRRVGGLPSTGRPRSSCGRCAPTRG